MRSMIVHEAKGMKTGSAVLSMLLFLCAGCYYTHRSSEGQQISLDKMEEIRIGQTNEADLLKLFGPPTQKERRADGTDGWKYTHIRVLSPTLAGGMVIEPIQRKVEETFEIALENGVVQSYKFLKRSDGGNE
jgi:hypothetical protein